MPIKVLIVEDDPDITMAVSDAVEQEGYEVVVALDISVAEALIRESVPDVAIVDHGLPDGTGDELAATLTAVGTKKIIMYTAQAQKSIVMSSIKNGAIDYVLKGSGIDELIDRVKKHAEAA